MKSSIFKSRFVHKATIFSLLIIATHVYLTQALIFLKLNLFWALLSIKVTLFFFLVIVAACTLMLWVEQRFRLCLVCCRNWMKPKTCRRQSRSPPLILSTDQVSESVTVWVCDGVSVWREVVCMGYNCVCVWCVGIYVNNDGVECVRVWGCVLVWVCCVGKGRQDMLVQYKASPCTL